jgi:predicted nucleotide-binding protein (sugar kinase/HSP70/actin superfamily)
MNKEKLIEIANDAENKSNKDLNVALTELTTEFDKTKELIVSLTRHLDVVTNLYNKIDSELSKRIKK